MGLHPETFGYLSPTNEQKAVMQTVRSASAAYAALLDVHIPEGPDKTYLLRKLREVAMWANMAITRGPDGSPRS